MNITFIGAARQVTGSCTLIEWRPDRFLIVDCGMEQGDNPLQMAELPVPAPRVEYVFLTHAHIDHSGFLPMLYRNGFRGTIYSTPETENLCRIMLADSAQIQESDAQYQTKKNLRAGLAAVEPLYTMEDAANVMRLFHPCEYGRTFLVDEGLTVKFTDAGHLLGSSFVEFDLEQDGKNIRMVCSGDVGNLNQPIIRDPQPVRQADYLLIESTYGTRLHDTAADPIPLLTDVLERTFMRGGTVIIPSFAVGRTQELLYFFREIKQKCLVHSCPDFAVYVDSPLANEATAVFLQCSESCLDEDARQVMRAGENPIWFDGLHTVISADESKALNGNTTPKVIIASGGMCEGGRIRHHLKHNIWNEKNTILFAGYQANGTLGRIIYDGAKQVKILGETMEVRAEVSLLNGISGHADREGLLNWIGQFDQKPQIVFVNHGDEESSVGLASAITDRFGIPAFAPCSGSSFNLLRNEWIRMTDPVYKKSTSKKESKAAAKQKDPYRQLLDAAEELNLMVRRMEGHANDEIRKLTKKIQKIIQA